MIRRLLFSAVLGLCASTAGAATLQIVVQDGPGEGFNDPTPVTPEGGNPGTTLGAQRLNLFRAAASYWGALLKSNVKIKIGAKFDVLAPCDNVDGGVLGQAGPNGFLSFPSNIGVLKANTFYPVALAEAATGTNQNTTDVEINAQFNSDIDNHCLGGTSRFWYGITSPPPDGSKVALFTTVLHELGHGLGFLSLVCVNVDPDTQAPTQCSGTRPFGSFAGSPARPDIWAWYLANGNAPASLWKDMTDAQRQNSILGGNLVWTGGNVANDIGVFQAGCAGCSNGRLKMYAPNPAERGSSVSHFDESASPNLLMEPYIDHDVFRQVDLAYSVLKDIGWTTYPRDEIFPDNFDAF